MDVAAQTDDAGQFSFVLPINPEITPTGSYYEITCPGHRWTIALPSAGTRHLGDPAIQVAPTVTPPAGASTSYVDGLVAALDARLDALEAAPAPADIVALTGFFDLAGQTRTMFRATSTGSAQNPVVALRAGKVIGLSVTATAARTAGTATFTALINGTPSTVQTVIDGTTPQYAHTEGEAAFAAGARLAVTHADVGFTPSTNYEATIWLEYDPV